MRRYTNTYRVTLTDDTREKLGKLKQYSIRPAAFIRLAIEEKMQRDLPALKSSKPTEKLPF